MNILITGGTGLIGKALVKSLSGEHRLTVVTRDITKAKETLDSLSQNSPVSFIDSIDAIDDMARFHAIINLAGEPIADKRWTTSQKKRICNSRWDTTAQLVAKINSASSPPRVFLSGSAIGVYGDKGSQAVTEETPPHSEFTHELCAKWEAIANTVDGHNTRVCTLRTGVVLAKNGGALAKMALPFKLGVGGKLGHGKQFLSWIHIDDMVKAIRFLLDNDNCRGAFNMTAPEPVTNSHFSHTLAGNLSRPCLFTVPSIVMKVAMGESSTMILNGQNVIPAKLTAAGFTFDYPTLNDALSNIYRTE